MTFARRRISVKFQLGQGDFGEGGFDTVELTGYRMQASITKAGGVSMAQLNLRIYGLASDIMNRLTILNQDLNQNRHNIVIVSAGDDDAGLSVCFQGTIIEAWADMNGSPDTSFYLSASEGAFEAAKPTPPISYNGSIDCALAAAGIAHQMGYAFENSGVSAIVRDPYLSGTAIDQLRALARAGNYNCILDNGTVAIFPPDQPRKALVPLISKDTGMVGYPAWTQSGIQVTTLYNPSIVFNGAVKIESILTPAAGLWLPYSIGHDLESEMPAGKWYTHMDCGLYGYELPIAG